MKITITEDMIRNLLTGLNERLKKDHIKEAQDNFFVFSMMQVKRISVYNHEDKTHITASI